MMACWMYWARAWLGEERRSFSGMSLTTSPPSRIRPMLRLIASRPMAPCSAKGLMKMGPPASAMAAACREPRGGKTSPRWTGRSSVVYSRPPSRLVVPVRGSA